MNNGIYMIEHEVGNTLGYPVKPVYDSIFNFIHIFLKIFDPFPYLAFYENFVKILSINIQATEEVKKLLEISDIDGIKKVRERIENFEENVDENCLK